MRTITLPDFLTPDEIKRAQEMYREENYQKPFAARVCDEIITPNMARINKALGQENSPMYLAYAVEYAVVYNDAERGALDAVNKSADPPDSEIDSYDSCPTCIAIQQDIEREQAEASKQAEVSGDLYPITIREDREHWQATAQINWNDIIATAYTKAGAIARVLDKANHIGGWTVRHFSLPAGFTARLDQETSRHYVTDEEDKTQ